MVAIIEGHTFRFGFHHGEFTTTCIIERETTFGEWQRVAQAVSVCHPSDNFCKETGRKIALLRALKDNGYFSTVKGMVYSAEEIQERRNRRRAMWNAYHSRGPRTQNRVVKL